MPQRVDASEISNDDALWRRIVNHPEWISADGLGGWRVSSAAFLDRRSGEVSVHWAKLTTQTQALAAYPDAGLVEILAGLPRSLDLIVAYDPQVDDPSHSLICAPGDCGVSKSKARKLAATARWLVKPQNIRA